MTHPRTIPIWLVLGLLLTAAAVPARAEIKGTTWFPIGPGPARGMFAGGSSGRATAVALNPVNDLDIYLGTAGGGVWNSTDGGQTWRPLSDDQPSLAIGAMAVADCTGLGCGTIYAGTGEDGIRRDTYYGRGLLVGKSLGNGTYSWALRTGYGGLILPSYNFFGGAINNLVLDPTTSGRNRVIYISLSSGVTASASEATVTAPEPFPGGYGIYKSVDEGLHWQKLVIPGSEGYKPTELEMDPTNEFVLLAGFMGRGIFRSGDKGATWCPLNPGIPRASSCPLTTGLPDPTQSTFDHVEVAFDHGAFQHVYALFGMCPDQLVSNCQPAVFETTDLGLNWTKRWDGSAQGSLVDPAPCPGQYSRYTHDLSVPFASGGTLTGTIFLSGIRLCSSTAASHGQQWHETDFNIAKDGKSATEPLHFDHHMVAFNATGSRGYDLSDGGIALSTDGGKNWTPINDTIQTSEFQSVGISPITPRVIGGLQDNGTLLWLGAQQWQYQPPVGDGGFSILDANDSRLMYTTSNEGLVSNTFVPPMKSFNGGAFQIADTFLPDTEQRLFYPPFIQDPKPTGIQSTLYFGTNRLFQSTDDASSWTDVSPVLSTDAEPEIWGGQDAITAIAVAPTNHDRIYIGYYSGKVFTTSSPCNSSGCWFEMDAGLPRAPITSLAVDPANENAVFATLSGFFPGIHVYYKNPNVVQWFPTGGNIQLNGLPINTIALESSDPPIAWLGTEKGVYKSVNNGGNWFRFSDGLPNVPVYQIAIDPDRQRVFAATHGRGMFMLTGPYLTNYGDCKTNFTLDVPIYGGGFTPSQVCTVKLLRQDGTVCASSTLDAIGGTIKSDSNGDLFTLKNGSWNGTPVVFGCKGGTCLQGVKFNTCSPANNPLTTVVTICGSSIGIDHMPGCPNINDPPSTWLLLTGDNGGFNLGAPEESLVSGPAGAGRDPGAESDADPGPLASLDPAIAGGGTFVLIPAIQTGDGTTRTLCAVNVPFSSGDVASAVLGRARDSINADAVCQTAGATGDLQAPDPGSPAEDDFAQPPHLSLRAPGLGGNEIVSALRIGAGQANGLCLGLDRIGNPIASQVGAMRVRFDTGPTGALGGTLTLSETSSLGTCNISIPTAAGQTAAGVAQTFAGAFLAPGIPGPNPGCPSPVNPRDVAASGASVLTSMASRLDLCVNDPGIGVTIAPEEICATDADCDDGNPCTHDTCLAANGQCSHTPEPDGLPCDDANACTTGNACVHGTCGTPVVCNDGNACTTDTCDPATGACISTPVVCDDGNACTIDFCNADLGKCMFLAQPGATCDDGNLCTVGDTCQMDRTTGLTTCQGTPACADGNPCTEDVCDPATGACLNPPVSCDDGNPCTIDFCDSSGACQSVPGGGPGGSSCDDGNLCTIGDACVTGPGGQPACVGQPVSCDDDNSCTVDSCDPATGGCLHAAVAVGDVAGLVATSRTTMTWSSSPEAFSWNTYRGTIPAGMMGSRAGGTAGPLYDQTCFEQGDSHGDGPLVSTDTAVPPLGTAFYYLISKSTGCGEGPLGEDSNHSIIPNASACFVP